MRDLFDGWRGCYRTGFWFDAEAQAVDGAYAYARAARNRTAADRVPDFTMHENLALWCEVGLRDADFVK